VQDAVWALPNDTSSQTIFIYPGTYKGQVVLWRPGPTVFQGYTKNIKSQKENTVLLTNSLVASVAGSNAKSATLQIYSNDTTVYNIDIENSYGTGGAEGSQSQALALCQAGARNGYYSSGFYSFQVCPEIKILATIEAVANGIN
jgi:pectinesterase